MNDLIDTTEMYLRTLYELGEEGIPPLRARIAERLHQSGPTVSQTVARMERDGLLVVHDDRRVELTEVGRDLAEAVMRKHRLAERLLVDVIGLPWELVHDEACRWEHVVSEDVERRLVAILNAPQVSPYGNPIPGLDKLGVSGGVTDFRADADPLTEVVPHFVAREAVVVLRRIGEHSQADPGTLAAFGVAGLRPDARLRVLPDEAGYLLTLEDGRTCKVSLPAAEGIYVARVDPAHQA